MTDQHDLDRLLDTYFAHGSDALADRVIRAALERIDKTPQSRSWRSSWRSPSTSTVVGIAGAAMVGVLAVGGLLYVLRPGQSAVVGQSPAPTASSSPSVVPQPTASWRATSNMNAGRADHTATLLPDGMVLVAGGFDQPDGPALASAELYNPAAATWTRTGSMHSGRGDQTATLLPDGDVLVAGGFDRSLQTGNYPALASAELYNSATGTWTLTGNMQVGRANQTATLLADGEVLVAGGSTNSDAALASAELYDPRSGTWSATGQMLQARSLYSATLLPDGDVLAAGGHGGVTNPSILNSAEIYHVARGSWTATDSMFAHRMTHAAILLPDGRVLAVGGSTFGGRIPFTSAELYDPHIGSWSTTGSMVLLREWITATLLPDGDVLAAGGSDDGGTPAGPAEVYDPKTGLWFGSATMVQPAVQSTATLLPNGTVLVVGGRDNGFGRATAAAEIFTP
jgi:WD40 repeat protein